MSQHKMAQKLDYQHDSVCGIVMVQLCKTQTQYGPTSVHRQITLILPNNANNSRLFHPEVIREFQRTRM